MAIQQALKASGTTVFAAALTTSNAQLVGQGDAMLVSNPTNGVLFVKFGADNTVAATTAQGGFDVAVLPGRALLVGGLALFTWAAVILAAASTPGPAYITRGEGSNAS